MSDFFQPHNIIFSYTLPPVSPYQLSSMSTQSTFSYFQTLSNDIFTFKIVIDFNVSPMIKHLAFSYVNAVAIP
jgi:hypothetical protein